MGIEQSNLQANGQPVSVARTGAIPRSKVRQNSNDSERSSPHPSLSSDADVPYVSYTVNKPIGESPKHQGKLNIRAGRGPAYAPAKPVKGRNIVVVSQKASLMDGDEEDGEIQTLLRIPLFLPIIRSSLSTTHPREPDIVDRLDSAALQRLVGLLEDFMRHSAESVSADQSQLVQGTKDIDAQLSSIMTALTDRQKTYARCAEKLTKVHEVAHSVARCQLALTTALDSIETLNRQLPASERLEPFVWSTG